MTYRIAVDFNTMNADAMERVYINTYMYPELLNILTPALRIVIFDEEFEVDALAEYDQIHAKWYGVPDWRTRRDL